MIVLFPPPIPVGLLFLRVVKYPIPLLTRSITDLKLMQMHTLEARKCFFLILVWILFSKRIKIKCALLHDSTAANSQVIG